jgi:small subunit ribosomal protein S20
MKSLKWEVKTLPNIKSAKKRVIVTETKTLQNKMFKTALKTAMKKYEAAVASGDKEAAAKAYALAVKKLDVAAAKGVVHKNNAARKKSQYTLMLNGMGA